MPFNLCHHTQTSNGFLPVSDNVYVSAWKLNLDPS